MKTELPFFVKQESDDGQMFTCENINLGPNSNISRKLKETEGSLAESSMALQTTEKKHQIECAELKDKIKNLTRENKILRARIQQLQTAIQKQPDGNAGEIKKSVLCARNRDSTSDSGDENVYEVEKIVSHETKRGVERFQIRWKGFDSSHDTWERKENLNCPKMVREYFSNRQNK